MNKAKKERKSEREKETVMFLSVSTPNSHALSPRGVSPQSNRTID